VFGGAATAQNSGSGSSTSASVSASNLVGNWSISSLFGVSFPSTPYSLTFTQKSISLNGGCNSFSFPYSIDSVTQIMNVSEGTSTLKACGQSDDQLFVSGVTKMYKYLLSTSSSAYSLNFYDQAGNAGYKLTMPVPGATKIQAVPQLPDPFAKGTALMLLLKRRDLPRAIVDLTSTSLTYTRCNTMTHSLKIDTPKATSGNLVIALVSQTKKACPDQNDQLYIDTLNSAVAFSFDSQTNTILLKDKSGVEVVSLNRT
jgi:heat shock protein HslJ